jgi:hypothetical protein
VRFCAPSCFAVSAKLTAAVFVFGSASVPTPVFVPADLLLPFSPSHHAAIATL